MAYKIYANMFMIHSIALMFRQKVKMQSFLFTFFYFSGNYFTSPIY